MRGHIFNEKNTYLKKFKERFKQTCRTCNAERARNRRIGIGLPSIPEISLKDFLSQRTEKTESCWIWKGNIGTHGYGKLVIQGVHKLAHRISYEVYKGVIPKGKQLDHLCRLRHCINPEHLQPVTLKQNVFRGIGITAKNRLKSACNRGHEFTKENTSFTKEGHRVCKECSCLRTKKYYLKHKLDTLCKD